MARILMVIFLVFINGCDFPSTPPSTKLQSSFDITEFDKMTSNAKSELINNLEWAEKFKLLAIILPDRGFGTEFGEVKFLKNGEFIYDYFIEPSGMGGGNPGDDHFKYLVGHWKITDKGIELWKNTDQAKIEFISSQEGWSDFRAYAYPDGDLYLRFNIAYSDDKEKYFEKSFQYLTKFGSSAIEHYSKEMSK